LHIVTLSNLQLISDQCKKVWKEFLPKILDRSRKASKQINTNKKSDGSTDTWTLTGSLMDVTVTFSHLRSHHKNSQHNFSLSSPRTAEELHDQIMYLDHILEATM
jgi:hypothetical protein